MNDGTENIEVKAKKKLQASIEASLHEPFSSIVGYLKARVGRYANTEEESVQVIERCTDNWKNIRIGVEDRDVAATLNFFERMAY